MYKNLEQKRLQKCKFFLSNDADFFVHSGGFSVVTKQTESG